MKPGIKRVTLLALALVVAIALVISACAAETKTVTQTRTTTQTATQTVTTTAAPGAAVTVTQTVPGPTVTAPAATVTKTVTATAAAAKPEFTLKLAEAFPAAGFYYAHTQWWVEEVYKRTNGRVEVKPYYGGSLAGWVESLDALQAGLADIAHVPSTYFPSEMPLYMMVDMVTEIKDPYALLMAAVEILETNSDLQAELEGLGLGAAMFGHWSGLFHYGFRDPVTSLEGLKGKSVRTYGGSLFELEKRLGLNSIFMNYADIYEATARGTVDGAGFTYVVSDGFKHWEVMNYVFKIAGSPGSTAAHRFMRAETWNSLPQDIQDILMELRLDWTKRFARAMLTSEFELQKKWEFYGVTITEFTPAERQTVARATLEAQEAFIKQIEERPGGERARDVWTQFEGLREKYQAEVDTKGYPWW